VTEHKTEERKSLSGTHWRSETERLQWETTERALDKTDHLSFARLKGHVHGLMDK